MTDDREKTIRYAAAHFTHADADSGEHYTMLCEVLADLDRLRGENTILKHSLRWAMEWVRPPALASLKEEDRYWKREAKVRALLDGGER